MRQYARYKQLHPGCILLFRIGDFYEMFDDDAVAVSKALGLTLTQRSAGVPMAGMPYHQLEVYLRRLVAQGFRVAVCDQVEKAEQATGLIERAVTRVLTPGTLVDETLLADDRPSTLAAVCFENAGAKAESARRGKAGERATPDAKDATAEMFACVAIADLSTGAFTLARVPASQLDGELLRRAVSEVLYAEPADGIVPPTLANALRALGVAGSPQPGWHFRKDEAVEALGEQFGVAQLGGFGLAADDGLVLPAGAIIRYLRATQAPDADPRKGRLQHLLPPRIESVTDRLLIDAASLRALEIDRTLRAASGMSAAGEAPERGSLIGVFTSATGRALCRTAMGKRLLRDWLVRPLCDKAAIEARQRCTGALAEDRAHAQQLGTVLEGVQDVARIGARLALLRVTPRDLVALGRSLGRVGDCRRALEGSPAFVKQHADLGALHAALAPLAERIAAVCVDEPPPHLREGGLVRPGVDAELDEARLLKSDSGRWLAEYQGRLIEQYNLPSLKVGYNRVFGYFIELPKGQAGRAPAELVRRQTLTNAERYITPELKAYEDKVSHADARALAREEAIFAELCLLGVAELPGIAAFGQIVAELDVLMCFADKAAARGWVRPVIVDEPVAHVVAGRHPVLDELLNGEFVPNDVSLGRAMTPDGEDRPSVALITGPNMAGKSTFIRQTALLLLLAHAGSYVPAESAVFGLTDRIFTRIGADDALHAGQSTFMVEMTETANILHNATARSLIVLDEIGRGTSTLDGLSLAWAIAEYLANFGSDEVAGKVGAAGRGKTALANRRVSPRTLFATHYHELTKLEELLPGRVANLQVSVREWGDSIVFLHRIVPGRSDRSYGIHVAKLAGIPPEVVKRASEILESLSVEHGEGLAVSVAQPAGRVANVAPVADQWSLFAQPAPHPAVDALKAVDLDALTPLAAFDALRRLKELL